MKFTEILDSIMDRCEAVQVPSFKDISPRTIRLILSNDDRFSGVEGENDMIYFHYKDKRFAYASYSNKVINLTLCKRH